MASALNIAWVAGRLRVFAAGELDLADERTLARVTDLLAEYTSEERAQIGAQAIEFGADAFVVQGLMNLVGGEVIEVTSRAPRTRSWWWLAIVGGVAAVGLGVGTGLNARRRRRVPKGVERALSRAELSLYEDHVDRGLRAQDVRVRWQ
jgi:hypothetical protein